MLWNLKELNILHATANNMFCVERYGTTNATSTFLWYAQSRKSGCNIPVKPWKRNVEPKRHLFWPSAIQKGHPKRPSGYPNSTYMAIRSSVLAIRSSDRPPTWSSGHPNVTYMWSSGHPAIHLATYMVIRSSTWPSTLGDLFELLCAYNEPRVDVGGSRWFQVVKGCSRWF